MSDVDPVHFGRLINAVDNLEKCVENLTDQVDTLTTQVSSGKGFLVGLSLASAGIGASMSKMLEHLFK